MSLKEKTLFITGANGGVGMATVLLTRRLKVEINQ
jgi:NADPH:quinone reductase-like Zn-dependent oxidoreductase